MKRISSGAAFFALVQRVSHVLADILLAFILVGALGIVAKQRRTSGKVVNILEADLWINCIGILISERRVHAGGRLTALMAGDT